MHYGVRVQLIPDRTNGDGGLEAFVSDEGIAFQCYAPQDPVSLAAQTKGQKLKISTDTQKLVDRTKKTTSLLGEGNVIRQWVLLTPTFDDKALVEHANKRTSELRQLATAHPWCHDEIRVSIHTDSLFASELAALALVKPGLLGLSASPVSPTPEAESASLEQILRTKLTNDPVLAKNEDRLLEYADSTLRAYFRGGAELTALARHAPTTHRAVEDCAATVLSGIAAAFGESEGRQLTLVKTIRDELRARIEKEAPSLQGDLLEAIAAYYIAAWWVLCPLRLDASS